MAERALPEIMADLASANQSLIEAREREAEASRNLTRALNEANRLMAEFDAAVAAMRKTAPPDTNWRRLPGEAAHG